MLWKIALCECSPLNISENINSGFIKTASGKITIEPNSERAKILGVELEKHPTALFFRAKAIKADEMNSNGDYFTEEELLKSYKSFEGVPFFTNHDNQNVENARGKVIFAEWIPEEKSVYTIAFVDREAFPHICRSIEEEYVSGVSMGALDQDALITMYDLYLKKIKDVKEGDKVLSPFGNICKVTKVYSAKLNNPMYKIITKGYKNELLLTGDHPVYVIKLGSEKPEFVEVKDVESGSFILIPLRGISEKYRKNIDFKPFNNDIFAIKERDELFLACKIDRIEKKEYTDLCYDLKVENDESYIADGIAVHNCSVEYSTCSICGNVATKTEEFCTHIRNKKGRVFSGTAKDVTTGETKQFKNAPVFEFNHGIKFIELSAVVDPACQSCKIEGIINKEDCFKKVANLQNTIYMFKSSSMEKEAGQEEVNQLNQVLSILETITISLIKNRQQVEVEFASDLVGILSELQTLVDELVGAGYGKTQGVPGVAQPPPATESTQNFPVAEQTNLAPQPVPATPQPAAQVGTITGAPTKPLVQGPSLPISAPLKPRSYSDDAMIKVAGLVDQLKKIEEKINTLGDDDMAKRRTNAEKIEQKKVATEVLSTLWKEKQELFEYIKEVPSIQDNFNKLSVKKRDDTFIIVAESKEDENIEEQVWTYDDLTSDEKELVKESPQKAAEYFLNTFANNLQGKIKGDGKMSIKEAGAKSVNKQPEVITEVQLESKGLYHPRTGEEKDVITQKQLENSRKGEQDVITEVQLEGKANKLSARQDSPKEVITEKQLEAGEGPSPRTDKPAEVITQAQLEDNGNRTGTDTIDITEKQLDNVDTAWQRAANRDPKLFKSADEHINLVLAALADTVIETGCTPNEITDACSILVSTAKDKYELSKTIIDKSENKGIDYSKRLAYWSNKNIKLAAAGQKQIAGSVISNLQKVAADSTINPDVVMDAMDVIIETPEGVDAISKKVDEKLEAAKKDGVKASRKTELKSALKSVLAKDKQARDEVRKEITEEVKKDEKAVRASERKNWTKKESKEPDTKIVTNFDEIGISKESPEFRTALKTFARGALASQNIKLAAITNVTINGDTITIAVQTDEGNEAVEIPVSGAEGEMAVPESETVPEGDMSGEGLGSTLPSPAPAGQTSPLPAMASNKSKMTKQAQMPAGGAIPPTGMNAGGPGAPEANLPGTTPADQPTQSLTTDPALDQEISDEIPTAGEQQPLGSVCPECGTSDVDVTEEAGDIKGTCKNPDCGAQWEAMVKKEVEYKIIKPGRSGSEPSAETPEVPEVPALPVAAQTRIDKGSIVRIANNVQKHGHVCPACGMNQCKASVDDSGSLAYKCPACNTDVKKDIIVDLKNPKESYMRVQWDLVPNTNCKGCKDSVKDLLASIKVGKMIKQAATTEFPLANCKEYIARKWGGNTSATFGPCKGQLLADCICGQLQKLGLRTTRYINRLASVYTQKEPMEECLEDQKKKGYEIKEAHNICNCLKKKFASEADDNAFIQAFAEDIKSGKEKILTANDLKTVNGLFKTAQVEDGMDDTDVIEDVDLADAVPPIDGGGETVTIEVSKETAEELAGAAAAATEEVEIEVEVDDVTDLGVADGIVKEEPSGISETKPEESVVPEEEKDMAMSMQTHKLLRVGEAVVKVAAQPKKIESIEGNVEAGVPRGKATLGKEGPSNIDVPMAKPSVPRGSATMGHEGPDNINKPAGLPDVPVDSSFMGKEKEVQTGMPAINNEIKGTVIAGSEKVTKEAKTLKEVDTVEKDVEAGVPRGKATIGNESKDNIDVDMAKPSVPRGSATMGHEGPDNIDKKMDAPDVPMGDAYMGGEKAVQKDMPANNDEILKNVKQKRDVQIERIAAARKQEAMKVAYKLLATKRISEEAFDDVVESLGNFEIDKISTKAEVMYPKQVKTSSVTEQGVHAGSAIVLESKDVPIESAQEIMVKKLVSAFTIGNKSFDEKLTRYGIDK